MTCSLAKQWLKVCDTSHSTCKTMCQSGWHPTRLVFVGTPSQPALRICLRAYINPNDRYITLSHRWGFAKFFTLTKSNYQQCLEQIQPEDLPQTFQDAITIARDLDTKYIWIDSLCIIQDSLDDWARESLEMADVYSYSYCTIAAAAASDGTEGCIRTRQNATTSERDLFQSLPEGIYQFVDPMLWEHEVTLSPLSKRAWVLQESVLSRRTLYFCSNQLFFGCSNAGFCEQYPQGFPETIRMYKETQPLIMSSGWSKWTGHGIPTIPFASGLSNVTSNQSSYLQCWNILLQDYCRRAVTNPQDKLIAISGLANRIHAANPTTSYFAGMDFDDKELLDQLLWQPAKPSSRLPTYIAPTWSWASVQGEI
ncbi:HET-domain-containing protein, partial [Hyaloscypha variabilis F]